MTHDPNKRNLFYIVLPKTGSNELAEMQRKIEARIPEGVLLRLGMVMPDVHTASTGELINRSKKILSRSV